MKVPPPTGVKVVDMSGDSAAVAWDPGAEDVTSYLIKWIPLSGGRPSQVLYWISMMKKSILLISCCT